MKDRVVRLIAVALHNEVPVVIALENLPREGGRRAIEDDRVVVHSGEAQEVLVVRISEPGHSEHRPVTGRVQHGQILIPAELLIVQLAVLCVLVVKDKGSEIVPYVSHHLTHVEDDGAAFSCAQHSHRAVERLQCERLNRRRQPLPVDQVLRNGVVPVILAACDGCRNDHQEKNRAMDSH